MKIDQISKFSQFEYLSKCDCGRIHKCLTQGGNGEYETEIYFLCDCGEYVEFILPVN